MLLESEMLNTNDYLLHAINLTIFVLLKQFLICNFVSNDLRHYIF